MERNLGRAVSTAKFAGIGRRIKRGSKKQAEPLPFGGV
jgi:hypothetical protein